MRSTFRFPTTVRKALGTYLVVFAAALGTFLAAAVHLIGSIPTTGDEPWYLLQAYSIVHFHTVDLARAIHDAPVYARFLGTAANDHARDFVGDGEQMVTYLPGYAAIIGPLYTLGGRGIVVAAQAIAAALAALLLFAEAQRLFQRRLAAFFALLAYLTCLPALVYTGQIFPSTFATLAAIAAYILVARGLAESTGRRLGFAALAVGGLAAVLPWLHVKYAPLTLVIAGAALAMVWRRWRSVAPSAARSTLKLVALASGGPTLISFAAIGLYSHAYFDTWYPQYRSEVIGAWVAPDLVHMLRLYGQMFFDPQSGLVPWAPLMLLVPLGLVPLARRHPREAALIGLWLIGLLSAFVSAAIAPHVTQAFALPARFTVESLPFLALCLGALVDALLPVAASTLVSLRTWRGAGLLTLRPALIAVEPFTSLSHPSFALVAARRTAPVSQTVTTPSARERRLTWAPWAGLVMLSFCALLMAFDAWLAIAGQLRPALLYPSPHGVQIAAVYPHLVPAWWFALFGL
jgi:hypothetical protein